MGKKKDESLNFLPVLLAFLSAIFLVLFLRKRGCKKNYLFQELSTTKLTNLKKSKSSKNLNFRQKEILDVLSSKGEITVEELMKKIKNVSERTLRRDMKKLEELGLSNKEGNTKGSKYIYIG